MDFFPGLKVWMEFKAGEEGSHKISCCYSPLLGNRCDVEGRGRKCIPGN